MDGCVILANQVQYGTVFGVCIILHCTTLTFIQHESIKKLKVLNLIEYKFLPLELSGVEAVNMIYSVLSLMSALGK